MSSSPQQQKSGSSKPQVNPFYIDQGGGDDEHKQWDNYYHQEDDDLHEDEGLLNDHSIVDTNDKARRRNRLTREYNINVGRTSPNERKAIYSVVACLGFLLLLAAIRSGGKKAPTTTTGSSSSSSSEQTEDAQKLLYPDRVVFLGERHSGVEFYIEKFSECFPTEIQFDSGLTRDSKWFQDKPLPPRMKLNMIFILLVRDPYDWVEAMRTLPPFWNMPDHAAVKKQSPNGTEYLEPLPWDTFVKKPWTYNGTEVPGVVPGEGGDIIGGADDDMSGGDDDDDDDGDDDDDDDDNSNAGGGGNDDGDDDDDDDNDITNAGGGGGDDEDDDDNNNNNNGNDDTGATGGDDDGDDDDNSNGGDDGGDDGKNGITNLQNDNEAGNGDSTEPTSDSNNGNTDGALLGLFDADSAGASGDGDALLGTSGDDDDKNSSNGGDGGRILQQQKQEESQRHRRTGSCQLGFSESQVVPCQPEADKHLDSPIYELNPTTGKVFADILELRRAKMLHYLNELPAWHHDQLMGPLVVFHYEHTVWGSIERLAKEFKESSWTVDAAEHCRNMSIQPPKLDHKLQDIDPDYVSYLTQHIAWEVEEQVGYERPKK